MQSLITPYKRCYFCFTEQNLEKHHCMHGTANRKLAEQDGLWVWLCAEDHRGTEGVHGRDGHEKDLTLKMVSQTVWMEQYGTKEEFIKRYGKSWL